jgi:H+-transporting ATPase
VFGTQIVATLIAVYGLFMTPLGWGWALFVWGYALVWFILNDRVKLLAYRIFDRGKGDEKPAAKANANVSSDLTPQIARRAYELYEQEGRREGHAAEDWAQAERGVRQDEAKAESAAEAAVEPKPDTKSEPKAGAKASADPAPRPA